MEELLLLGRNQEDLDTDDLATVKVLLAGLLRNDAHRLFPELDGEFYQWAWGEDANGEIFGSRKMASAVWQEYISGVMPHVRQLVDQATELLRYEYNSQRDTSSSLHLTPTQQAIKDLIRDHQPITAQGIAAQLDGTPNEVRTQRVHAILNSTFQAEHGIQNKGDGQGYRISE